MTADHFTTYRTDDKTNGLTLGDLHQFLQEALPNEDPRRPVKVRIGFRGQIRAITTGDRLP